ncbi:integrase core domain-containing protein [Amycolatopsis sp. lyj-23]|uniref:integrase core domain-containing protein n=1 Tax=Amycolatopsis sp. lyj-23 TaxID=2789283 RepID=UPI00397D0C0C
MRSAPPDRNSPAARWKAPRAFHRAAPYGPRRPAAHRQAAQAAIEAWAHGYNYHRPHQSLGVATPGLAVPSGSRTYPRGNTGAGAGRAAGGSAGLGS